MSDEVLIIDGGIMEGGGQILRMAAAFSALLRKPISVKNIRAGRTKPGLRPQHLKGLELVSELSKGKLLGGGIGCTKIAFYPTSIAHGAFYADTGTAGSIMLLCQVSLPCLLYGSGPSELHLKGGTNAEKAPQIDYTVLVFKPVAEKFGVNFDCTIKRRGYYPKGGGEAVIKAAPIKGYLSPVEIVDFGNVSKITGRAFVAGVLPIKMAHAMASTAEQILKENYPNVTIEINRVKESPEAALGNGSGIVLVAETTTGCILGASNLGRRGVQSNDVGEVAAKALIEDINVGACVDRNLQDQLIIFMALANGTSRIRTGPITLHTETAIHIAEMMTDAKFSITEVDGSDARIIECQGIGLQSV